MAIEEKPLLDMLVAWSSSHLSLYDDGYRIGALEHRSTALQSFTTLLSKDESPETSLACCLVFCSMSAILGDTTGWQNHLVAAANIIRHASPVSSYKDGLKRLSSTYEGRWLLRNFAYHDVLMSVTSDREPLIPGRYWISQHETELDSYVGLASELLAFMSEIKAHHAVPRTTPRPLAPQLHTVWMLSRLQDGRWTLPIWLGPITSRWSWWPGHVPSRATRA
jgi:hypothetical protein